MGLVGFLFKIIFSVILLHFLLVYSPFFVTIDPVSYTLPFPETLSGPLAANGKLNNMERLFEDEIIWPESFAVHEGKIYTGVNDGRIMKIDGVRITPIARTGKKCEGQWEEEICGRPLGLRFDKNGLLYVADASYGLLTVDVKTGDVKPLIPSSTMVGTHNLTLLNDLVIDSSGTIYFTQSSTRWPLTKIVYMFLEHNSDGRLLSYDPKTKKTIVLAENMFFPNGIELSHDGQSLLVAECLNFKVLRYHLSGPKKGKFEPFLSNLPGEPDNIRRSKSGGYWIGFNQIRSKATPNLADRLSEYPAARKVIARLIHAVGSVFTFATQFIENPGFKELAFNIQSGRFIVDILPTDGMILEVDANGKILRSLQSSGGTVGHFSQVLEHQGHLYIGSWRNRFIGRIKD